MTEDAQIALFDETQMPSGRELLLSDEEQKHRYTTEIVRRNKARYLEIVRAIANGVGVNQICRAFGVSHHTVTAIRQTDAELVATEKERGLRELRELCMLARDRCREVLVSPEPISARDIGVLTGILEDKKDRAEGNATVIVSVRHELDQDRVFRMFEELANHARTIDVAALDSESGTDGHVLADSDTLRVVAGNCVDDSSRPTSSEETTTTTTTTETGTAPSNPAGEAGQSEEGGGGTSFRAAGSRGLTPSASENLMAKAHT